VTSTLVLADAFELADAFLAAPVPLVVIDVDGRIAAWNDEASVAIGQKALESRPCVIEASALEPGSVSLTYDLPGITSKATLARLGERWIASLTTDIEVIPTTSPSRQRLARIGDALPDRAALIEETSTRLTDLGDGSTPPGVERLGLAVVTIGDLEALTSALGHAAVDTVVRAAAQHLSAELALPAVFLSGPAFVARLAATELGVIVEGGGAVDLLDRVEQALATLPTQSIDELAHTFEPVAGLAVARAGGDDADHLLSSAAAAHNEAAVRRIRVQLFHEGIGHRSRASAETRRRLAGPGMLDELRVHYQPVIDLRTDQVVGAEALVRWEHPELGLLRPKSFIAAAEEGGQINAIGTRVLEIACSDLAGWRAAGVTGDNFTLGINVAPSQLDRSDLVPTIEAVLALHGLDPSCLCVEVTESTLLSSGALVIDNAERLRSLGLKIAIDDFGTGYSSLAQLRRLPVTTLKLDRSFVRDLDRDEIALTLADGVMTMARGLALDVVAEGAERPRQAELLRDKGCDLGQGYFWSQPIAAIEFALWLADFGT
jgi:EAL domain-containing protein (putative c-di-GMP-specific phosphodiesterase class I)